MCNPQRTGGSAESVLRRVLGCPKYLALNLHHGDTGAAESDEPVDRRRAGAERWGTEHEGLLQFSLGVVEECLHQSGPVAESAEDCALAHTRPAGDGVHRHGVDTAFGDEQCGRVEEKCAITCCVTALDRCGTDLG